MSVAGRASRREKQVSTRLLMLVLSSAVFVAVMTASMVNVVMPAMREEFGASEAQVGWVVTGFMLVLVIGAPIIVGAISFVVATAGMALVLLFVVTTGRAPRPRVRPFAGSLGEVG